MHGRSVFFVGSAALLWALSLGAASAPDRPAAAPLPPGPPAGAAPDNSDVRFTIGEASLLECLRAGAPYALTVGAQPVAVDLVLDDPSDLHLREGRATFKIRVKSRTLPIDQILSPVVSITYDRDLNKYFAVLSSLPLQVPGLPAIDLKDYTPRFEIPAVVENAWRSANRAVGLNVRIRRVAILDHALEMGGRISVDSSIPSGSRSAR